jgi:hypothetical protein
MMFCISSLSEYVRERWKGAYCLVKKRPGTGFRTQMPKFLALSERTWRNWLGIMGASDLTRKNGTHFWGKDEI